MTTPFQEACAWLDTLQFFGIKLGLEQSRELADRCGAPDRGLRFLHIAGTNGKGSTGAMLERALRENGCVTGFYSSPHLISVRERIRINGRAVTEEVFAAAARRVREVREAMLREGKSPTYFEVMTVMALLIFREAHCGRVIWETGMGGRLDATNIVTPEVSIITGIALDHRKYLGDTLEAIAGEKGGIIKPGVPVVLGDMPEAPRRVLQAKAAAEAAPVFAAKEIFPLASAPAAGPAENSPGGPGEGQSFQAGPLRVRLSLPGPMQRSNSQTVLTVLQILGLLNEKTLRGLALTRWPGRAELCAARRVLVDGGHNPDGIAALCATLRECWPGRKFRWVFGAFADKDYTEGLRLIAPLAESLEAVGFAEGSRLSAEPAEIAAAAESFGVADCRAGRTIAAILEDHLKRTAELPETPLVVAGSLYLAGEALAVVGEEDRILNL